MFFLVLEISQNSKSKMKEKKKKSERKKYYYRGSENGPYPLCTFVGKKSVPLP